MIYPRSHPCEGHLTWSSDPLQWPPRPKLNTFRVTFTSKQSCESMNFQEYLLENLLLSRRSKGHKIHPDIWNVALRELVRNIKGIILRLHQRVSVCCFKTKEDVLLRGGFGHSQLLHIMISSRTRASNMLNIARGGGGPYRVGGCHHTLEQLQKVSFVVASQVTPWTEPSTSPSAWVWLSGCWLGLITTATQSKVPPLEDWGKTGAEVLQRSVPQTTGAVPSTSCSKCGAEVLLPLDSQAQNERKDAPGDCPVGWGSSTRRVRVEKLVWSPPSKPKDSKLCFPGCPGKLAGMPWTYWGFSASLSNRTLCSSFGPWFCEWRMNWPIFADRLADSQPIMRMSSAATPLTNLPPRNLVQGAAKGV